MEKDVILTAETGSGKTLAYLVPIAERLIQMKPQTYPAAIVMVPSRELVFQVAKVVELLFPELFSSTRAIHGSHGPSANDKYLLAIGTPRSIVDTIPLDRLKLAGTIVLDEADLLLSGSFVTDSLDGILRATRSGAPGVSRPQHVFVGATLPGQGRKSVQQLLQHLYSDAIRVDSGGTHRINPKLDRTFVGLGIEESTFGTEAAQQSAIQGLGTDKISPAELFAFEEQLKLLRNDAIRSQKLALLTSLLDPSHLQDPTNYIPIPYPWSSQPPPALPTPLSTAYFQQLSTHASHILTPEEIEETNPPKNNTANLPTLLFRDWPNPLRPRPIPLPNPSNIPSTLIFASTPRSVREITNYLQPRVAEVGIGEAHAKMREKERMDALESFRNGDTRVLVTTDVLARGLDVLSASHVIEADFATDAVVFLHRAGRTGRRGEAGRVTSIVGPDDTRLAAAVLCAEAGGGSLDGAFSRRRGLRRKMKKREQPTP